MDRNNIIGLILIFAIFAGSFYLMKPSEAEIKQEQILQDSLKNVREGKIVSNPTDSIAKTTTIDSADLSKPFGAATVGQEQLITLENDLLVVKLSSKGGKVKSVLLKGLKNFDGTPLYLLEDNNNNFGFLFNAKGQNINTNDLYFTAGQSTAESATLRLNYSADQYLEYSYTLPEKGYNLGLKVTF